MIAVGTALAGGAGVKFVDLFLRRGGDVAKTSIRERSKRKIAEIALTGEAQADIANVTAWALNEFRASQTEQGELLGKVASLETANNALRSAFDKMKLERDKALSENAEFVKQVTSLIAQAKDLQTRLAHEVTERARGAIELEGARARIEKYEETVRSMTAWIAEAQQREASLEAELEHARAS